jgi:hypothetical protein
VHLVLLLQLGFSHLPCLPVLLLLLLLLLLLHQ